MCAGPCPAPPPALIRPAERSTRAHQPRATIVDMPDTHLITVEPLGVDVPCRADQTILDSCLRHGVNLPHACTHGTCGTCKVEVLDGDVELGDASAFALLESERGEGKALICTATPRTDVTIEADVEEEDGVVFHPVRENNLRV